MIDLHTHTNYSDGTWSLKELLIEAQKAGVKVLSITDHDNINSYRALEKMDYSEIFSGDIIVGCEFNTVYNGVSFHLLACDLDYKNIEKWIFEKYQSKPIDLQKEFDLMLNACKMNNIRVGNIKYNKNLGWPVDIIFNEIKKYYENKKYFKEKEWENIDIFYNSCITNIKFPVFVDFSIHYPTADEVSNIVKKFGGKLFIAHAFKYNLENISDFLNLLKDKHIIDGIEVYHSSFTKEQIEFLKDYCEKNNLLVFGGSDCHGNKKPDRKIGTGYDNLNINKDILNKWDINYQK